MGQPRSIRQDSSAANTLSRSLLRLLPSNPHDFLWPESAALRGNHAHLLPFLDAAAAFCKARGLSGAQVEAVELAAAAAHTRPRVVGIVPVQDAYDNLLWAEELEDNRTTSVQVIQGPPGTGKTSTIVCMTEVLAGSERTVLVCAPTNVAVQQVAFRLMGDLQVGGSL
eukprot:1157770-Pelagomonas_calceolata.AAC.10